VNFTRWIFSILTFFTVGILLVSPVAAAQQQEKAALESARATYRAAVKGHGQESPEALAARNQLRQARKSYHDSIRQNRRAQKTK